MKIQPAAALVAAVFISSSVSALAQAPPAHLPRGTATDISNAEIHDVLKKTASHAVNDTQIKVVGIKGEHGDDYNIAVGVIHRARGEAGKLQPASSLEHGQVTEVYHFLEGSATFVTGGTMDNPKESAADSQIVKVLAGPSTSGGAIQGGVSRRVGAGDVVVIPPNTPHGFSEITTPEIVYLVIRVDSKKVLPAGYSTPK